MNIKYTDTHKAYLWFSVSGLSIADIQIITSNFKAEDVYTNFEGSKNFIEKNLKSPKIKNLKNNLSLIDEILNSYKHKNIKILIKQDKLYPHILKKFSDSPEVLYLLGDENLLNQTNLITIVGSRFCTRYGETQTENIVKGLVDYNMIIVSGLAEGIDTIAAKTAFNSGGKAIAVIAGGFYNLYPKSNINLFKTHIEKGLVISEFPPETLVSSYMFPLRNRIMARIALGTVVTEAGEKSGALITADYALSAGREIFVLPANVTSKASLGCLNLIKSAQGAMITNYKDILKNLGIEEKKEIKENNVNIGLTETEQLILENLKKSDMHIEGIMKLTCGDISSVTTLLTIMEIKGLIKKLPSNFYGV